MLTDVIAEATAAASAASVDCCSRCCKCWRRCCFVPALGGACDVVAAVDNDVEDDESSVVGKTLLVAT